MKKKYTGYVANYQNLIQLKISHQKNSNKDLLSKFRVERINVLGILSLIIFFTFNINLVDKLNAQWSSTNYASGNINTVFSNGSDLLVGTNGGNSVTISPDNGTNWGQASTGMVQYSDVRAFAANTTYVFAGSTNGVYRSANTGTYSWTKVLDNASCFALLTNGSDIFAGTMGGGVYYSGDNGSNWTQVNTGLTMLHVYALAYNGTYLFAGTYHNGSIPGQGVFRSSDNGQTWTQINNGLTNSTIMSFAVKGSYIFAGTNGGGIFRSGDNGDNWTNVAGGIAHTLKVVCGTDLYAGFLSGGGISISTDNGNSWTAYSTGLPNTGGYTVTSLAAGSSYLFSGSLGGGVARAPISCVVPATICGKKFNDLNGNSNMDSGETGLPGWEIQLKYNQDTVPTTLTQVTDSTGSYCFYNLRPGVTYTVSEINQPGWTQTFPGAPYTTYTVTALPGQNYTMFFGNKQDSLITEDACITWDLLSTGNVSSTVGQLTGTPEMISPGTSAPLMSIYSPYFNIGQGLWVGNTGWVAGSLDPMRYVEFNTSPVSGRNFTANTVSFDYGDYPLTTDFNILNFNAYYSTDNWTTSTLINGIPLIYKNSVVSNFTGTISGEVLVTSGQTFSLRIYPYAIQNGVAMTPTFAIHSNVKICGTTSANFTSIPQLLDGKENAEMISCYPNPFSRDTKIQYFVPKTNYVRISVYDIYGKSISTLVNEIKTEGKHEVIFDADGLASGIYLYSISTEGITQSKRMVIMKR